MHSTSGAEKNTAFGVSCAASWRLTKVTPLADYRLQVEFVDGVRGFVDMSQRVMSDKAGVFALLRDVHLFNRVHLEYGVVTWPGNIDLAPDAMHDSIKLHGEWLLS